MNQHRINLPYLCVIVCVCVYVCVCVCVCMQSASDQVMDDGFDYRAANNMPT